MKRKYLLGLGLIVVAVGCAYYLLSTYTNYLSFVPSFFSKNQVVGSGWIAQHEPSSTIKITGVSESYLELLKKHGPDLFTQNQRLSFILTTERQKITINAGKEPIVSYSIEPGSDEVHITVGISNEQANLFDEKQIQNQIAAVVLAGVCEHSLAIELQTVPLAERSLRCDDSMSELSTIIESEVFTAVRVEKLD